MVSRFVAERDWQVFHSPKNLAMSLSVEAAELLEHFLWMENAASRDVVQDAQKLEEVGEELADILCNVLCLCNAMNLDLSAAFARKMSKNVLKYPAGYRL
jgi:NTP pyrophosphatase (non-canonical NTP hydrolase)